MGHRSHVLTLTHGRTNVRAIIWYYCLDIVLIRMTTQFVFEYIAKRVLRINQKQIEYLKSDLMGGVQTRTQNPIY